MRLTSNTPERSTDDVENAAATHVTPAHVTPTHVTEADRAAGLGGMVPDAALLDGYVPGDQLTDTARPIPTWRTELRHIPNVRNAGSVISVYVQTIGIIAGAIWVGTWWAYLLAFVLMGRAHAQYAALMHEAAHRLLFSNKTANDLVGRWLLGYVSFTPTDVYRRGHMAHHKAEFGPQEPDIPLYRGYPISKASMRRKLIRDATGQTGIKLLGGLLSATRSTTELVRRQARSIVLVQLILIGIGIAVGHPWTWLLLWFLPYLTIWRVINRLRSIAEHGGMHASSDRRETTHSVAQHPVARFILVPYHIGWHMAHHVDAGIPMNHLPAYHRALRQSGYISDALEWDSYPTLWRALSAGTAATINP